MLEGLAWKIRLSAIALEEGWLNATALPAPTLNDDQLRMAELVVWLILRAFCVPTAVAAPPVTNCEGPAGPQDPATQGTGNCGAAALTTPAAAATHNVRAVTRIPASCGARTRMVAPPGLCRRAIDYRRRASSRLRMQRAGPPFLEGRSS